MLKIDFHLEQENASWNAEIHQLNSDVLKRHILPKITSTNRNIDFEYCDKTCSGKIIEPSGNVVGDFTVH
ncbi:hypothetical protein A1OO_22140 [Enterovibrio norvegicus FF-33]|uniref:Uncharacterized protein n=1 Tax=Enterovibrio norvegicus FF-454 TaxID=1185651 RepID=A0A1E5C4M3_9GAMM|nr:hypothetical protein [Enterovibrio norvegicus]OEE60446.1 hypothetical protein A1OK_10875 [Enterovibrio norvegicus FF-454]OEE70922.1 hypothetical protein A1OO_22140 [Enterovibrio norvegicus FF-33]OEE74417.1 hypothetical protein A1OQ_09115 [Enterovibrio norvegicus FF-162]